MHAHSRRPNPDGTHCPVRGRDAVWSCRAAHRRAGADGARAEETRVIRIVVPFDINLTNPNRMQSLHWRGRRQREARGKYLATMAWMAAGKPTASRAVGVTLIVRRGRRLDDDNAVGGAKC